MKSGFSLVELSIVLVILGLLTGGILAGQSLIRAAEIRSVSSDLQRYQAAFYAFYDKYRAVPGDMHTATQYWGSVTATLGQVCPNGIGTGTQTCDGDGDGRLYSEIGIYYEPTRFWQHLSNAGLIAGNYTGVQYSAPWTILGTNIPRGRISNTGFAAASWGNTFNSYNVGYTMIWGQQSETLAGLTFGASTGDSITSGAALTPAEAWSIDVKIDDGKPDYGELQGGGKTATSACYTAYPSPAEYNLANNKVLCAVTLVLMR